MTEPFRDRPWRERLRALGDEAERAYVHDREHRRIAFTEYGMYRPPFHGGELTQLPNSIRYAPDFMESRDGRLRLVEVQGIGADQRLKMKDDKLETLLAHDKDLPVWMFVWNNRTGYFLELPLGTLAILVAEASSSGQQAIFDPDGTHPKPYVWVAWDKLAANAATHRIARDPVGSRVDRSQGSLGRATGVGRP